MEKKTLKSETFQEFLANSAIDLELFKAGSIVAARESYKKLRDLPKLLQSKTISDDLQKER